MKLFKPEWVNHDGFPIFSVDVHPDGTRFATGGQGTGDSGRVVIWNMDPLVDEDMESSETCYKQLARMDNHLNCVNCVRWSRDGKYLASGGDDKVIMIWSLARVNHGPQVNSMFGGSTNVESYRCVAQLRGHQGDILDLNWSPEEPYLASCSVDNSVIVWNTNRWNDIIVTLKGHTGLVKGVSWDPVGKFLASQSDDKSIKIWRVNDWKEETCVTDCFKECGGTTHVLRLNWSPDGKHLVTAHAMNNLGSVAQIIEREGWKMLKDFVGHRKAVTCVRFNPHLMKNVHKNKKTFFTTLAIGSRDRSISIWTTQSPRPLMVYHELFQNSIMDVSWTPNGLVLLVCSFDGTIAYLEFTQEELGLLATEEDEATHMESLYGKRIKTNGKNHTNHLVEEVSLIRTQRDVTDTPRHPNTNNHHIQAQNNNNSNPLPSSVAATNGFHESMDRSISDSRSSTGSRLLKGPTDKQIETKLVNGKRRITPLYIPPMIDLDGIPVPYNTATTTFSTSQASQSKIPIEKRDDSNLSAMDAMSQNVTPPKAAGGSSDSGKKTLTARGDAPLEMTNGVKRKLDPSEPEVNIIKKRQSAVPKDNNNRKPNETWEPKPSTSTHANEPSHVTNKTTTSLSRSHIVVDDVRKPKVTLEPLNIQKSCSLPLKASNQFINIDNNISGSDLCLLKWVKKGTDHDDVTIWEVIMSSPIRGISTCDTITAASCADNTISVFSSKTGRRLHSAIALSSPLTSLSVQDHMVMAATTDCRIYVWDFAKHVFILKGESMEPLFTEGTDFSSSLRISSCHLMPDGTPVVSISNRKSYVYDLNFGCWSLVSAQSDILPLVSDLKPTKDIVSSPLAKLQATNGRVSGKSMKTLSTLSSKPHLRPSATISYMDQQLAASFALSSGKEYRFWLLSLAQSLMESSKETRLRELCSYLLGPVLPSEQDTPWVKEILGNDKRDLLSLVLSSMASCTPLQHVHSDFKEQLDAANKVTPKKSLSSREEDTELELMDISGPPCSPIASTADAGTG